MLLVDHGEAQALELDSRLEQRVGAHDELYVTAANPFQNLAPRRRAQRARQQARAACDASLREQATDVAIMLIGQDLRRRHQGGLVAVVHGDEQSQQRHDRLARADVALEQPVHRVR